MSREIERGIPSRISLKSSFNQQVIRCFPGLACLFDLLYDSALADCILRADCCALAAVYALVVIDLSVEVDHMDRIMLAGLLALHTADTGDLADLHSLSALVVVAAQDMSLLTIRYQRDNVLRASLNAQTAGYALILIDHGQPVLDNDCILRAYCCTVALAQTPVITGAVAGEHQRCCLTGINAVIDILGRSVAADTITVNHSSSADHLACRLAEDLCTLFCHIRAAGRAKTDLGCTSCQRCSITVTTGKTAGTAVSAGKYFPDFQLYLINGYGKDNGSHREKNAGDQS